jgi:LEA14-like dessication related protein
MTEPTNSACRPSSFCRLAVPAFLVVVLAAPGCELLDAVQGRAKTPSARVTSVRLQDLDLTATTLLFDIEVSNPYATAIPLVGLDYELESQGSKFVGGKVSVDGAVPAHGSRVVPVPARIVFADLLKILEMVKPGAVIPYTAGLTLSVDVPAIGPQELPLTHRGELPIPAVPAVDLASIQWEKLSLNEATALLELRVVNRNEFPVDLSALSYALSLGDVSVVKGSLQQAAAFAGGGESSLPVRASFSPRSLGVAAFGMLTGKGASYKLEGTMTCKTPFGALDFPYERSGQTEFRGK